MILRKKNTLSLSPIACLIRTERDRVFFRNARKDMMLFRNLVEVSRRVRATTRKKEKITLLAECLKRRQGQEIALAASYLSGQIPQGSLGMGWKTLQKAMEHVDRRPQPLGLLEVSRFFDEIDRL